MLTRTIFNQFKLWVLQEDIKEGLFQKEVQKK